MLSYSKAPKTQQVAGYKYTRKISGLFDGIKRASAIILLTDSRFLCKNFPFPFYNLEFLGLMRQATLDIELDMYLQGCFTLTMTYIHNTTATLPHKV